MNDEKREKIIAKYGTDIRKLNIENVKKWIKALRSRKFKKTTGTLYDGEGFYCALGVAAKVAGLRDENLEGAEYLPSPAMKWLGVEDEMPEVGKMGVAELNDDGKSFAEIARRIETWWVKPYEKYKHCFLAKER
jgi:hypothetical protein